MRKRKVITQLPINEKLLLTDVEICQLLGYSCVDTITKFRKLGLKSIKFGKTSKWKTQRSELDKFLNEFQQENND
jgi:hypothetical protein